eukprot:CAMPEP_0119033224 /NCGR_PEP_ID=MMETSP1177-20130426/237_1 /TAXON_ID=2985 /ORGANISM="Ochromonas sp, Strain CCMP1899" /LENGTH=140 /DNA_ID=CAMNT_0006989785 /DNA_START=95 /DNA_END=517 /DNA_ORIENTATION=+
MLASSFSRFAPAKNVARHISHSKSSSSQVGMGIFDSLFGKAVTASASHILVKGPDASKFLTKIKKEIESEKDIPVAFADAAAMHSSCPSSRKGGSLGTFKPKQMVPEFDKVVFSEAVGAVHGPIKTQFGAHLILIENRSE